MALIGQSRTDTLLFHQRPSCPMPLSGQCRLYHRFGDIRRSDKSEVSTNGVLVSGLNEYRRHICGYVGRGAHKMFVEQHGGIRVSSLQAKYKVLQTKSYDSCDKCYKRHSAKRPSTMLLTVLLPTACCPQKQTLFTQPTISPHDHDTAVTMLIL